MTSRQEQTRYEQWKSRLYLLCAKVSKHSSSDAHWPDSRKNCHKIRLVCSWFWKVSQTSLLSKKVSNISIKRYSFLFLRLPLPKSQTSIKLYQSLRKTPKKYFGFSVFEFYESDIPFLESIFSWIYNFRALNYMEDFQTSARNWNLAK